MMEIKLIPIETSAISVDCITSVRGQTAVICEFPAPRVPLLKPLHGKWTLLGLYSKGEIDFEPGEDLVSDEPLPHIFSDHPDKDKSKMFKDYVKEVFIECVINPIIQSENLKGERFAVIVKD